jgi:hypothetical protein
MNGSYLGCLGTLPINKSCVAAIQIVDQDALAVQINLHVKTGNGIVINFHIALFTASDYDRERFEHMDKATLLVNQLPKFFGHITPREGQPGLKASG